MLITCNVMFVVANAALFAWLLVSQNIPKTASDLILSVTKDPWYVLLLINFVVLIMECFWTPWPSSLS